MTPLSIRTIFINRMNGNNISSWFNLRRNLGNLYTDAAGDLNMTQIIIIIRNEIYNNDYIPRIIIKTLNTEWFFNIF